MKKKYVAIAVALYIFHTPFFHPAPIHELAKNKKWDDVFDLLKNHNHIDFVITQKNKWNEEKLRERSFSGSLFGINQRDFSGASLVSIAREQGNFDVSKKLVSDFVEAPIEKKRGVIENKEGLIFRLIASGLLDESLKFIKNGEEDRWYFDINDMTACGATFSGCVARFVKGCMMQESREKHMQTLITLIEDFGAEPLFCDERDESGDYVSLWSVLKDVKTLSITGLQEYEDIRYLIKQFLKEKIAKKDRENAELKKKIAELKLQK